MSHIEFREVEVTYKTGLKDLKGVSLTVDPGEVVCLIGASGSGKSTFTRLILREYRPSTGKVWVGGSDLAKLPNRKIPALRRQIGTVFQDFRLLDHLTTYENVALPLRVLGREEVNYRAEVTELLRWVGLGDRINAYPQVLSGGEKQRAAIARAVISRPEFLLADEPTGNVDPELSLRLVRLFAELNKMGTTIILATHELPLLDNFHFPRMMLDDGRVSFRD